MKITILVFNNVATTVYEQAGLFIKNTTGIDPVFEFVPINNPTPPLKIYGQDSIGDWWGIDFDYLKTLSQSKFTQALCVPSDAYRVLSCSLVSGQGENQISQVNAPEWSLIIHELLHGFFNYTGRPDSQDPALPGLHKLIRDNDYDAVQAFTVALQQLEPYYSKLEEEKPMLDEFVKKYAGKKVNFDGVLGAQCTDLVRFYIKEVLELPQPPSIPVAYQIWTKWPFPKINQGIPKTGDMIVWGKGLGSAGHVAVVISATETSVKVFEQNNPIGSPCRVWDHDYQHVLGWLRPLKLIKEGAEDMLIRLQGTPRCAYVSAKDVKHEMSEQAWIKYFDSARPKEVTQAEWDYLPSGVPVFFSANFGSIPEDIWGSEDTDVIL